MINEIRDRVAAYVRGDTSLRQFEDWFLPAVWDVADAAVNETAAPIMLAIAEHDNGHLDESELKERLIALVSPKVP
jgi:hypothetical protein